LANFSVVLNAEGVGQFQPSGWSAATTLGQERQNVLTLKALGVCGNNPFRVPQKFCWHDPGLSLRSNRWAEISERLRRKKRLKLANAFGVKNDADISERLRRKN